jgi:folate-dependent tRNA-U54 methylase TrmFO/GidA
MKRPKKIFNPIGNTFGLFENIGRKIKIKTEYKENRIK